MKNIEARYYPYLTLCFHTKIRAYVSGNFVLLYLQVGKHSPIESQLCKNISVELRVGFCTILQSSLRSVTAGYELSKIYLPYHPLPVRRGPKQLYQPRYQSSCGLEMTLSTKLLTSASRTAMCKTSVKAPKQCYQFCRVSLPRSDFIRLGDGYFTISRPESHE